MRQFSGNNRKRSDSGDRKPFGKKRFEKPDYKPRKSYSDSDETTESRSKSSWKIADSEDSGEKKYSTFSKRAIPGGGSRFRSDDRKESSDRPSRGNSRSEGYSSRSSSSGSSRFRSDDRNENSDRAKRSNYRSDEGSSRPSSERTSRYRSDDRTENNERPNRSFKSDDFKKRDSKPSFGDSERRPYLSKTKYMGEDNRSDKKYDDNRKDSKPSYKTQTKPVYEEVDLSSSKKNDGSLRLNKYISNSGVCSRREADEIILSGKVKVNGKITTELGTKVLLTDTITYKGKTLIPEKKVYVLINKPKDCVTTTDDPEARRTVFDMLKGSVREQLHAVGRLDRNTTGVLLLTNDGELTQTLTHPKFSKSKIYHAWLDRNITDADMKAIQNGIQLEDGFVKPDEVSFVEPGDKTQIGIEIHSGQNRVVRRIFEHFEYKVVKLDRVYFAGLTKKSLPRGEWRFLTNEEVSILKRMSIK